MGEEDEQPIVIDHKASIDSHTMAFDDDEVNLIDPSNWQEEYSKFKKKERQSKVLVDEMMSDDGRQNKGQAKKKAGQKD